jgi:hypothetical protein
VNNPARESPPLRRTKEESTVRTITAIGLVLIAGCSGSLPPGIVPKEAAAAEEANLKKLIGDYLKGQHWDNLKSVEVCESVKCRLAGNKLTLVRVKYHLHRGEPLEPAWPRGPVGPKDHDRIFEIRGGVVMLGMGNAGEGWQERELAKWEREALKGQVEFSRE